jgi:hypothetical protein
MRTRLWRLGAVVAFGLLSTTVWADAAVDFIPKGNSTESLVVNLLGLEPGTASVRDNTLKPVGPSAGRSASDANLSTGSPRASTVTARLPANLVYLQVSRDYLRKHVAQSVQSDDPVDDNILGTRLVGRASTSGQTNVELVDDPSQAVAVVTFTGTIDAKTLGYNGPVTLHNETQTDFTARKLLVLGDEGLRVLPTEARATSKTVTTDIDTKHAGVRGRIASRIAWDRVAKTRSQVEEIASEHAEDRIEQALDARVEESLADVRQLLMIKVPQLANSANPPRVQYSSTPYHIHIVVGRDSATLAEREMLPPPILGNPEIVVRMHRTIVLRALGDPSTLGPLVGQMLGPQKSAKSGRQFESTWSPNRDWLVVTGTAKGPSAPVAAK